MHRSLIKPALSVLFLATASVPAFADSFTRIAVPFGTDIDGNSFSVATSVSPTGVVAGYSSTTSNVDATLAFTYSTATGTLTNLGGAAGTSSSSAYGINTSGLIVGQYTDANFAQHGVTYTSGGGFQVVPNSASGVAPTRLNAVNTGGTFVGYGNIGDGPNKAIYGKVGTGITVLPTLPNAPGFGESIASAINTNGLIVGTATPQQFGKNLFRYDSTGTATSLTDLGRFTNPNGGTSFVNDSMAINNAGVIAGSARLQTTAYVNGIGFEEYNQAFKNVNVQFTALGGLAVGEIDTVADGINAQGVIVGSSETATGATHAVLWLPGSTTPLDLNVYFATLDPTNAALYTLTSATSISDGNIIVGTLNDQFIPGDFADARVNNGSYVLDVSALVAASVPEPVTLGTLLPVALLALRRRRSAR